MTRQIMRKQSFLPGGRCPQTPGIYRFPARMAGRTMEALERRIGLRRDATRAPSPAPEWRGRLRPPQAKSDPPIHNLLPPEIGLDNGVHFRL